MDGEFTSRVIDELRALLGRIEAGREPSNPELYGVIISELRRQERAAMGRHSTEGGAAK